MTQDHRIARCLASGSDGRSAQHTQASLRTGGAGQSRQVPALPAVMHTSVCANSDDERRRRESGTLRAVGPCLSRVQW